MHKTNIVWYLQGLPHLVRNSDCVQLIALCEISDLHVLWQNGLLRNVLHSRSEIALVLQPRLEFAPHRPLLLTGNLDIDLWA